MRLKFKLIFKFLILLALTLGLGYLLYLIPTKIAVVCIFGLLVMRYYSDKRFKASVESGFIALDKRLKSNHKNIVALDKNLAKFKNEYYEEVQKIRRKL